MSKDDTKEDCLVFGVVTNENLGLPWLILGQEIRTCNILNIYPNLKRENGMKWINSLTLLLVWFMFSVHFVYR